MRENPTLARRCGLSSCAAMRRVASRPVPNGSRGRHDRSRHAGAAQARAQELGGRKLPVIVDSPGGNVDAALALGRLIRKNKLDIAVGKTRFEGCLPDEKDCTDNDGKGARYFGTAYADGSICNSACPLMFSGGVRRVVGNGLSASTRSRPPTSRRNCNTGPPIAW